MTSYRQDARIRAGESAELIIAIDNPEALKLDDAEARYAVTPVSPGEAPVLSTAGTLVVLSDTEAELSILINGEVTAGLVPGWYHHEAGVVLRTGFGGVVASGQMRIDPPSLGLPRPTLASRAPAIRLEGRL